MYPGNQYWFSLPNYIKLDMCTMRSNQFMFFGITIQFRTVFAFVWLYSCCDILYKQRSTLCPQSKANSAVNSKNLIQYAQALVALLSHLII